MEKHHAGFLTIQPMALLGQVIRPRDMLFHSFSYGKEAPSLPNIPGATNLRPVN